MQKHEGWRLPAMGDEVLVRMRVTHRAIVEAGEDTVFAVCAGRDDRVIVPLKAIHSINLPNYQPNDTVEYYCGANRWRQAIVCGVYRSFVMVADRYFDAAEDTPAVVETSDVRRCMDWRVEPTGFSEATVSLQTQAITEADRQAGANALGSTGRGETDGYEDERRRERSKVVTIPALPEWAPPGSEVFLVNGRWSMPPGSFWVMGPPQPDFGRRLMTLVVPDTTTERFVQKEFPDSYEAADVICTVTDPLNMKDIPF